MPVAVYWLVDVASVSFGEWSNRSGEMSARGCHLGSCTQLHHTKIREKVTASSILYQREKLRLLELNRN
jgi:hypothetical protein